MKLEEIETAKDPDLRGTASAMVRAHLSAYALARRTGTPVIVMAKGKLVQRSPDDPECVVEIGASAPHA